MGLPESAIPIALLLFNVGVEAGQILFIAGVFVVRAAAKPLPIHWPRKAWAVPTYAIGALAAYWTLERIAAF